MNILNILIIVVGIVLLLLMQWAMGAYLVGESLLGYAWNWLIGVVEFGCGVIKIFVVHYWEKWNRRERKPIRW